MRPSTALAAVALFLAFAVTAEAGTGPVVVVDPGHDLRANSETEPIGPGSATRKIKDGGGTHGVVTGIREPALTLDVSLRLRALLRRAGVRVVMTRTRTASASMGNVARARIANRADAALFLRIHADGSSSSAARGSHTLVPALRTGWTDDIYRSSRRAASLVQQELVRALGFPDRGIQERVGLHRVQLGRRSRDPRRAGVHDEPRRGPPARPPCRRASGQPSGSAAGRCGFSPSTRGAARFRQA